MGPHPFFTSDVHASDAHDAAVKVTSSNENMLWILSRLVNTNEDKDDLDVDEEY